MIYSLRHGIRNLIRWLPIIWHDRDWDWIYLARIMRAKLLWMAELEENHGHHIGNDRDAKRQRICAELLRRLIDNEYDENATDHLPAPLWSRRPHENGMTELIIEDDHKEERHRLYKHAADMRKRDLHMFGAMIGKHLLQWWD